MGIGLVLGKFYDTSFRAFSQFYGSLDKINKQREPMEKLRLLG